MRILVCVKQVPESTAISMDEQAYTLIRDGAAMVTNPSDEAALEAALVCKEVHGASVSLMTMGKPTAEGMLRELAACGADELFLLTDPQFAGADTYATAQTLRAAIARLAPFDLIVCGRRAIDGETGQVGPELAALLDIPCVTNVKRFDVDPDSRHLTCVRLLEDGHEILGCTLPAMLTLCEYAHTLRLKSIYGLRRAQRLSVQILDQAALNSPVYGLAASPTRVKRVRKCQVGVRNVTMLPDSMDTVDRLAALLKAKGGEAHA